MATTTTPATGDERTTRADATDSVERIVGARMRRKEDPRFLTGRGTYTDDVQVAGTLHTAFVRSPHAHARIRGLDVDAARSHPGVIAVYTGKDLTDGGVNVAESAAAARDAAGLVTVDYDPLPAVADAEQALAAGAPIVRDDGSDNV